MHCFLYDRAEIDSHVAAENDVELSGQVEIIQQVVMPICYSPTQQRKKVWFN